MKFNKILHLALVATTCVSVSMPQLATAGKSVAQADVSINRKVEDVVLKDGALRGALVDEAGRGVGDAPVLIGQNGKRVAELRTDAQGRFEFKGAKVGTYQVVSHGAAGSYRVWNATQAPEAAKQGIIHTVDPEVARGARHGGLLGFLANPIVLAGVIAAAIAIPLALDDDDDAS